MERPVSAIAIVLTLLLVAPLWGCQSNTSEDEGATAESEPAEGEEESAQAGTSDPEEDENAAGEASEGESGKEAESGQEGEPGEGRKTIKGLITVDSEHDVDTTAQKLEAAIEEKGLKLLAKVDHTANAESVDLGLRPTTLLIFGNPKAGTPLMQTQQSIGIDLPMKALLWEHEDGTVHVSYNDPAWLAQRHGLEGQDEILGKMSKALNGIVETATSQ